MFAAGFAPAYPELTLAAEDMAPFQAAVDRIPASQRPYPAYALDGHLNILRTNRTAELLLPEGSERNLIRLLYVGAWRELIDNWDDFAWAGVRRVQADAARFPYDDELADLVELASEAAAGAPRLPSLATPRVLWPHSESVTRWRARSR